MPTFQRRTKTHELVREFSLQENMSFVSPAYTIEATLVVNGKKTINAERGSVLRLAILLN